MAVPLLEATDRRGRILAAAASVFAREGLDAPVPAVAAEAGIGVGTVYREFASKQALVAALVVERLERHRADVCRALAEEDPGTALEDLLWRAAERQASDHVFGAALAAAGDDPEVRAATGRVQRPMARLLRAAREQGSIRDDVTAADFRVVFAALRGVGAEGRDWRRALDLLLGGLRP